MDVGSLSLYLASQAAQRPGRWHDANLPDRLAIHWRLSAGTYQLIISRRGSKIPHATIHRIRQASHVPADACMWPANRMLDQASKETAAGRVWYVVFYWLPIDTLEDLHE